MWDFLTMECINTIDGPELPRKNVELSTICYLKNFSLIAVGTDLGKVFFWDLNKSIYLKQDYENYYKHKARISSIIMTENQEGKDYMITAAHDGLILVWEIESGEIKEHKTVKEIKQEIENKDLFDFDDILPKLENKPQKPKTFLNFKYLPQIKFVINTSNLLSQMEINEKFEKSSGGERSSVFKMKNYNKINVNIIDCQINVIAHSNLTPFLIYSGGNNCQVYVWNFEKSLHSNTLNGHKSPITCLTFDKHYLFSGSADGQILVWNTFDMTHLMTLYDQSAQNIKILDVMMIPKFGILVSITSDKKLNFWKYESKELVKTIARKQESLCLAIVNSYGKMLSGTKDKTIMEFDLTEILGSLNIPHDYKKFHFVDDGINYEKDECIKIIYFLIY
jgi:WD40 repeat protein